MMKMKLLPIVGLLLLLGSCNKDVNEPDQLHVDVIAIDKYLDENNIDAYKDISGVRFTIDSLGSGFTPRITDKVTFDYTGKLLSGSVFQSSTLTNYTIVNLIAGLQVGIPKLPNGSKATIYIPSVYAYGSQTKDNIPANSNLIFHIKLRSITAIAAEKTQRAIDTVALDNYLTTAGIANVVKDTSGLRYVIDPLQPGSGIPPTWFHKVKITYSGYLITNNAKGALFYTGTNQPDETNDSRVVNFIRGFQIGLQKMKKGGKATLYIPSVMAFGNRSVNGLVTVPANSNLIYEVEMTDLLEP